MPEPKAQAEHHSVKTMGEATPQKSWVAKGQQGARRWGARWQGRRAGQEARRPGGAKGLLLAKGRSPWTRWHGTGNSGGKKRLEGQCWTCWTCGEPDHLARECPKGKGEGRGKGGAGSSSGENPSLETPERAGDVAWQATKDGEVASAEKTGEDRLCLGTPSKLVAWQATKDGEAEKTGEDRACLGTLSKLEVWQATKDGEAEKTGEDRVCLGTLSKLVAWQATKDGEAEQTGEDCACLGIPSKLMQVVHRVALHTMESRRHPGCFYYYHEALGESHWL